MFDPGMDASDGDTERDFQDALLLDPSKREAFVLERCGGDQERARLLLHMLRLAEEEPGALPDFGSRYRTIRLLGHGGQGRVYLVHDSQMDRTVAAKLLAFGAPLQRTLELSRTKQSNELTPMEAQLAGKLHHPAILPIFEAGQTPGGMDFFTMQPVSDAQDLVLWYRKQGKDRERRLVRLLVRVCEALAKAHANRIQHFDIKPSNILVEAGDVVEGEEPSDLEGSVYVVDWGISATGGGTPRYMSPEQAGVDGLLLGEHTDVFGVGALIYTLLAGRPPYVTAGTNDPQHDRDHILALARSVDHPKLESLAEGNSRALIRIAKKAMAANPADRHVRMVDLLEDLRAFLERRPMPSFGPSRIERVWARIRTRKVLTGLVVTALVLGIGNYRLQNQAVVLSEDHRKEAREHYRAKSFGLSSALGGQGQWDALQRYEEWAQSPATEALGGSDRGWEWGHLQSRMPVQRTVIDVPGATTAVFLDNGDLVLGDQDGGLWNAPPYGQAMRVGDAKSPVDLLLARQGARKVLVGSKAGDLRIVDLSTGDPTWRYTFGDGVSVRSLAWHWDGRIALGTEDGRVAVMAGDEESEPEWVDLYVQRQAVTWLGFRSDGVLVICRGGELLRVRPDGNHEGRLRIGGPMGTSTLVQTHVALIEGGFLSADQAGYLRRWQWGELEPSWEQSLPESLPTNVQVHPLGVFFVACASGSVLGYGPQGAKFWHAQDHGGPLTSVALPPTHGGIVVCSDRGQATLRSMRGDAAHLVLSGHRSNVEAVAFHPTLPLVASGSPDMSLRLWDTRTGACLRTLFGHQNRIWTVAWSPDGRWLSSGGADGTLRIWDRENDYSMDVRSVPSSCEVLHLTWAQDGPAGFMAVCTNRPNKHSILVHFAPEVPGHTTLVSGEEWIGGDSSWARERIALIGKDGSIRWVGVDGGVLHQVPSVLPEGVDAVASSQLADGRVALASKAELLLVDSAGEVLLREPLPMALDCLLWSPDGSRLFCGRSDGRLEIRDGRDLGSYLVLPGHRRLIDEIAFRPSDGMLATASVDHELRLWSATAGSFDLANHWGSQRDEARLQPFLQTVLQAAPDLPGALTYLESTQEEAIQGLSVEDRRTLKRLVKVNSDETGGLVTSAFFLALQADLSSDDIARGMSWIERVKERCVGTHAQPQPTGEVAEAGLLLALGRWQEARELLEPLLASEGRGYPIVRVGCAMFLCELSVMEPNKSKLTAAQAALEKELARLTNDLSTLDKEFAERIRRAQQAEIPGR